MTRPEIVAISPFFIVADVPASMAFYRDRLGFEITFEGPEPGDIFFGIVSRGIARWDAFVYAPDPDALAAEFASRDVELFEPLQDTTDGLRGFEIQDADGYILFFGRTRTPNHHGN